jgi:hypothetical protein
MNHLYLEYEKTGERKNIHQVGHSLRSNDLIAFIRQQQNKNIQSLIFRTQHIQAINQYGAISKV